MRSSLFMISTPAMSSGYGPSRPFGPSSYDDGAQLMEFRQRRAGLWDERFDKRVILCILSVA